MRRARLACVLLAAALGGVAASGCFLDEIDKAQEKGGVGWNKNSSRSGEGAPTPAGSAAAAANSPGKAGSGASGAAAAAAAAAKNWWATARTLGEKPEDDTIAKCEIEGRLHFMRREECSTRGGIAD